MDTKDQSLPGLERSCGPDGKDWVRMAPDAGGASPERIEARFTGHAYSPHRHDTYAIGLTLSGVQSFTYRGETRHSQTGNAIVLHPDELHDGHASTETGFRYRMIYVDPESVREALDDHGGALPFVADGVRNDPRLATAILPTIQHYDRALEPLEWTSALADLATAMADLDDSLGSSGSKSVDTEAVRLAKEAMITGMESGVQLDDLEKITGQSRFALARHFRAACGVSPHRWLVMRRLDRARAAISEGASLAEAATDAGFADQSHMTRHFKSAYGMSPGKWRRWIGTGKIAA